MSAVLLREQPARQNAEAAAAQTAAPGSEPQNGFARGTGQDFYPARAPEYDFLRTVCMAAVVLFHYGTTCEEKGVAGAASQAFVAYANGTWGETASLVFLMLSGAVLTLCHPSGSFSTLEFHKKRWLSIFPLYYLAYALAAGYLLLIWGGTGYFANAAPFNFLLSALGMDGYFAYRWAGSYILGEWFLGAIVLLYLLYPLLAWVLEHQIARAALCMLLPIAAVLVVRHGWFGVYYGIYTLHNLWVCLLCFWLGMLAQKFRTASGRLIYPLLVGAAAVLAFLAVRSLGVNHFYLMILAAPCAFLVLAALGGVLMRFALLAALCRWAGRYSFAALLVHHVLFQQFLVVRLGSLAGTLPGCLLGLAAAFLGAFLLQKFYDSLCALCRRAAAMRRRTKAGAL